MRLHSNVGKSKIIIYATLSKYEELQFSVILGKEQIIELIDF